MALTPIDYLVVCAYLAGITLFGSWFARFQKTTTDYFLTGRSVPWWAICFTIVATETSTLSFVGVPASAYAGNMTFLQLALGYSHPVIFALPEGVQAEVDRQVSITLKGADKALLGQVAAKLRGLRKPDPYKGKGIKYAEEQIRRKVGKKAGAK